jgi:hypothetical protein
LATPVVARVFGVVARVFGKECRIVSWLRGRVHRYRFSAHRPQSVGGATPTDWLTGRGLPTYQKEDSQMQSLLSFLAMAMRRLLASLPLRGRFELVFALRVGVCAASGERDMG